MILFLVNSREDEMNSRDARFGLMPEVRVLANMMFPASIRGTRLGRYGEEVTLLCYQILYTPCFDVKDVG